MKKLLLLTALCCAAYGVAYGAAAPTISVSGSSGTINAGAAFTSHITLTIAGANTIGDVESINMLLATPSSGPNSGVTWFSITLVAPTSPFNNTNFTSPESATFGTAGDAANTGNTVTTNGGGGEVGSNTTSPVTVAATGTTSFEFETITFQSLANTPAGTYNFFVTSGGLTSGQGSFIENSASTSFGVNSEPLFTITISAVPEPSTWALLGLGGLGSLGMTMLRRRRA